MARKLEQWEHLLRELRAEFILREEELELLHDIDLRLLEDKLSLDEVFSFIIDSTQALLRSDYTSILLKRGLFLHATYASQGIGLGQRLSIPDSISGKCLAKHKGITVPLLSASPYRRKYVPPAGYQGPPMESILAVPISINHEPVGVLCAESTRPHAFRPVHSRMAQAIASQAAIALQRLQHFKKEALFAEVDQMILAPTDSNQDISRALERVVYQLHSLEGVPLSGAQVLFRKGSRELEIAYSTDPTDTGLSVPMDESICGRAVQEHRTVIVGDVSKDPKYRRMLGPTIQSEIAVPIWLGNEQVIIGVLNVESEEPDAFSGFNQIVLESFADKVRMLIAFAKLRADVTDALETRHASDLLVAVGDQTSNMIHRLNNTAGLLRVNLLELIESHDRGTLPQDSEFFRESLTNLLSLANRTLAIPDQVIKFLGQHDNTVDVNKSIEDVLHETDIPDSVIVELSLANDVPPLPLYSFDIVVQNLVRNAIDAMPSGGTLLVSTKLIYRAQVLSGYVQLTVEDTGTGIPAEILPHIFDLNFTTKGSRGTGLGLGLWWVRTFLLRSGGEISVDNRPDGGSEFIVKMPLASPVSDTSNGSAS